MTATRQPLTPQQAEQELLGRLGLTRAASSEDVEAAHRAVTAYLAHAPRELKDWARRQAAEADEAYALLIDPSALPDPAALGAAVTRSAVVPGGPATPPARQEPHSQRNGRSGKPAYSAGAAATSPSAATGPDDDFEAMLAAVTPTAHREAVPTPNVLHAGGPPIGKKDRSGLIKGLAAAAAVVGAVVVGIVVYNNGLPGTPVNGGTGQASPQPSAQASGPVLDQAAVAALMQQIQADPKDTEALMGLADEYYIVGDFGNAKLWIDKLLEVDPKNIRGLLASGAVAFNTGDLATAKTQWEAVLVIEPENVEAHYDLGFLYLNQDPPDMAGVQREWGKVVEIAPDSDVAQTVKAHLDAFASPAPSAGASAAPSPAPSASPAGSPTASPAEASPVASPVP
jgi:tetratricopeptide (TPR) repeat protein